MTEDEAMDGLVKFASDTMRLYKCSRCKEERNCVINIDDNLICVKCRYNDIGKDALYEALYNDLD